MNRAHLVDDTFVVTEPSVLAARVADPASWRTWWPDLRLVVVRDRGLKGMQWAVTGGSGGRAGSVEIWLEPWGDGVLVHLYLRLDAAPGHRLARPRQEQARRARAWKLHIHALKDVLERDRRVGCPAAPRQVGAAECREAEVTTTTAPARCPACGGALGTQAQWCGLCHADLRPAPPTAPPPVSPPEPAAAAAGATDAPADVVPGPDAERHALLVAETLLAAARAEADRQRPGLPGGWGSRSARTGLAVGLGVLLMLVLVLGLFVLGSLV